LSNLLEQLLSEQADLTAVEQFSRAHNKGDVPDQAQYYERLLPASEPKEGQQYAFKVDLDRCSGCKACVTACHSLNGLDKEETWRDVGLLIGGTELLPVMQHVTTACHHCLEPACAVGCPVNAYEKDPLTGIVKHLDDQCFGCQYCTMTCPYEVPKYHAEKGIVRKCDMCSERLGVGEAPACVQACPHESISIQLVDVEDVRQREELLVATSPASSLTHPTTSFESARFGYKTAKQPELTSVEEPRPQHAHWPLIIMLVLSQLSVGMFSCLSAFVVFDGFAIVAPWFSCCALAVGLASIAAATFHLGRPQYAFRAILGVTHSWLSREIVVFGAFAGAASLLTGSAWLSSSLVTQKLLSLATALLGLAGVFCSVMIYVFTRREFWNIKQTGIRFFLSTVISGAAASSVVLSIQTQVGSLTPAKIDSLGSLCRVAWPVLGMVIFAASIGKIGFETSLLTRRGSGNSLQLDRTRRLLTNNFRSITSARMVTGSVVGLILPVSLLFQTPGQASTVMLAALLCVCLASETCERFLFFAAVSPDRMPGGLS